MTVVVWSQVLDQTVTDVWRTREFGLWSLLPPMLRLCSFAREGKICTEKIAWSLKELKERRKEKAVVRVRATDESCCCSFSIVFIFSEILGA